jgi:hypothetical protein
MIHSNWRQAMLALIVCVPLVGYPVWALLDREPPYVRETGKIVPAPPQECGLPDDGVIERVVMPGSCVTVQWKIRVLRNCPPNTPNNITRIIQDSENVRWPIGPVEGVFGTTKTPPGGLTRYFLIPSAARPGRALYKSTATFACNPLQRLFWPISVSIPDIEFEIAGMSAADRAIRFVPVSRP